MLVSMQISLALPAGTRLGAIGKYVGGICAWIGAVRRWLFLMFNTRAFSAASATAALAASTISRRDPGGARRSGRHPLCGVCHSDLHYAWNEWKDVMPTAYPCVPGHEIVGRVASVGPAVTKFKGGNLVGVGCLVDSCGTCAECEEGLGGKT